MGVSCAVFCLAIYDRGGKCGVYAGFDLLGVRDVQRQENDLSLVHGQTRELVVLLGSRHGWQLIGWLV